MTAFTTEFFSPIEAGRAIGLLRTEIDARRMTLAEAEFTARLAFQLDTDDADLVCERLRHLVKEKNNVS